MGKAAEYRQFANDCRAMASATASEESRGELLHVADQWDALASEREREGDLTHRISPEFPAHRLWRVLRDLPQRAVKALF